MFWNKKPKKEEPSITTQECIDLCTALFVERAKIVDAYMTAHRKLNEMSVLFDESTLPVEEIITQPKDEN